MTSWRWVLPLVLVASLAVQFWRGREDRKLTEVPYSAFFQLATEGKIANVTVTGQSVSGKLKAQETVEGRALTEFQTLLPSQEDRDLLPTLREKGVAVTVRSEEPPPLLQLLYSVLPWLMIMALWFWLARRAQRFMPGNPMAGILKGHTKRYEKEATVGVKFDDVAGLKAAKQDLQEIVDFLKFPERYKKLGGKIPRGGLLIGPPGTGKTLLARAVAGEAGVPFFSISGSEFIELFVGVGASRVRELFEDAKKVSPSIVFIDEIDAVGRSRGSGLGGGHDEREQTLNQLLSEMDGFARTDLVVVLAATNRPDVLDSALLRPGRFDRRVMVDRPEMAARKAILGVHVRGKPLSPNVDLERIAATTPGFSGADLANLVNEAALYATRRGADAIEDTDFTAAFDKIVLGDPRETSLTAEEKKRVAVHESGHAAVAHWTPHSEALQRVSIIPRGMALGVTHQTPTSDRHIMTRRELESRLSVLMGGYAAESLLLGDISSGAENDLKRATEIAFKMVAHYGMTDRLGPMYVDFRTEHPFLGGAMTSDGGTSDQTIHAIEEETRALLQRALEAAKRVIEGQRGRVDALLTELLRAETLERNDLLRILGPAVLAEGETAPVVVVTEPWAPPRG